MAQTTFTQSLLEDRRDELLEQWLAAQLQAPTRRSDLTSEGELRRQSARFLDMLALAVADGDLATLSGAAWDHLRDLLGNLSAEHAALGFVPSETATFIFSLKEPLFEHLSREQGADPKALLAETWQISALLDKLGLFTVEAFLASRDEVIRRQQQEMLELSTPVVKLWEGVLALPLIGTLDSARTQVVMENLLQEIVETGRDRHHRHHRRADRRYAGGPAPAENRRGGPPDGRRVHHQRHPPADRPDHRPSRAWTWATSSPRRRWPTPSPWRCSRRAAMVHRVRCRRRPETGSMDRYPDLRMGDFLLVTIQVDMHDRLAMTLQDDLTDAHRRDRRARRPDRHLRRSTSSTPSSAGCSANIAAMSRSARCRDGGRRDAAGRRHHAGRARAFACGRAHGAECRQGTGMAKLSESGGADAHEELERCDCKGQEDVMRVRQAARRWAVELGFGLVDQTKIVTAASELGRNTVVYGGGTATGEICPRGNADRPTHHLRRLRAGHRRHLTGIERPLRHGSGLGPGTGWRQAPHGRVSHRLSRR